MVPETVRITDIYLGGPPANVRPVGRSANLLVRLDAFMGQLAELARGLVGQDYETVRNSYIDELAAAMSLYLDGTGSITKPRNDARRAIAEHFDAAFFTGYVDGGGVISEISEDDRDWFLARQEAEIGYVDMLFQALKGVRAEAAETGVDVAEIVTQRATGYSRTLDGLYQEGKLRANKETYFTLDGPDGKESCPDCQRLKGQRHKAKWWIDRGLVPAPGNPNYECGNWVCEHRLVDDEGNIFGG